MSNGKNNKVLLGSGLLGRGLLCVLQLWDGEMSAGAGGNCCC